MEKRFSEIIKKRENPGVLIFNMNSKLVYSNKEGAEVCLCYKKSQNKKRTVPEEIRGLYDLVKKDSTDTNYVLLGNNGDFKNLCSARAFPINNQKTKNKKSTHIMILLERIVEKHAADFEKIKKDFNLTKKELEVLKLIHQGVSNGELSKKLSIGEYTAKDHIKHIMKKMNIHTRSAIVSRVSFF